MYVCAFSSHSFWASSSLDVPAGVTQEEGHTGFLLIHLLSAVRALIFLARRIQPFLSLVDREVEFSVPRERCNGVVVNLHIQEIFLFEQLFRGGKQSCQMRLAGPPIEPLEDVACLSTKW